MYFVPDVALTGCLCCLCHTGHLRVPAPGKDTYFTVYVTTTNGHHLFGGCAIHDFKNIRARINTLYGLFILVDSQSRVHGILSPRSFESYPTLLSSETVITGHSQTFCPIVWINRLRMNDLSTWKHYVLTIGLMTYSKSCYLTDDICA